MRPVARGARLWIRRVAQAVVPWSWVALVLAAPLMLFPSPARTPALLVVPALGLVAVAAGQPPLPRTPLNAALLGLALMLLVSLGATHSLATSLPKLAGMVLGVGVFAVTARLGSRREAVLGVAALLAGGVGLALISFFGSRWPDKLPLLDPLVARLPVQLRGLPGAEEGFSPNQVAGTLLWVVPLALALLVRARAGQRWLADWLGPALALAWGVVVAGAALLTTLALLLTQSRIGLGALGVALLALAALAISRRATGRAWPGIALAVALSLGWAVALAGAAWLLLIRATPQPAHGLDTLAGRAEVWAYALAVIRQAPLTGIGMNTFRVLAPRLFEFRLMSPDIDISHAHNELLQVALDLGVPGLVAYLALLLGAARMLWAVAAAPEGAAGPAWPRPLRQALAAGLGGGLLAHFLFGLADALALGAKTGIFLWLLLGLTASIYRQTTAAEPP